MISLDDLNIYGDWLEENYIVNNLYKLYLNKLRIGLRKNSQYGFNYSCYIFESGDGSGHGDYGDIYGDGFDGDIDYDDYSDGNGWGGNIFHFGNWDNNGNGFSI